MTSSWYPITNQYLTVHRCWDIDHVGRWCNIGAGLVGECLHIGSTRSRRDSLLFPTKLTLQLEVLPVTVRGGAAINPARWTQDIRHTCGGAKSSHSCGSVSSDWTGVHFFVPGCSLSGFFPTQQQIPTCNIFPVFHPYSEWKPAKCGETSFVCLFVSKHILFHLSTTSKWNVPQNDS